MGLKSKFAKELSDNLKAEWRKSLKSFGVEYPSESHEPGLLALYDSSPNPLTQEQISDFYDKHSTQPYNKQLRHLASKGWDIRSGNSRFNQGEQDLSLSRDQLKLVQWKSPNNVWGAHQNLKRTGKVSETDWQEKLQLYKNHGCAVCGQQFPSYDKGHLNPDLPYSNENIVPICAPCNNWAQDKVVFKLYKCYLCGHDMIARPISFRKSNS